MALSFSFKLFLVGALLGVLTWLFADHPGDLSGFMLTRQDMVVLALGGLLLFVLTRWTPPLALPLFKSRERQVAFATATMVAVASYAGAHLATLHFPLSMDEFMAVFDARILLGGHLVAPIAPEWQNQARALQPIFMQNAEGVWVSTYLPVNATLHAAFEAVGDHALAAPLLAAVSIIVLYAVARRIWPKRPDAAVIAVLLLVTSSQFLVTAMTPYAMTAHLAFNLVWLWLYLRNTPLSHAGAMAIGFAATGLHQLVFHPLFVAPFVLGLFIGRRWRLAIAYTLVYAAICLFWASYWGLVLPNAGSTSPAALQFVATALGMLSIDGATFTFMTRNLFRFISWQNPAMVVLFILTCVSARRWEKPLPQLCLGIVLTVLAMALILPYQGHGWGYRYLHGLLGGFSLIAAAGWIAISKSEAVRMRGSVAACTLFALAMVPVRGWQMHSFTKPYAEASRAIAESDADVVIVDPAEMWFGGDLVRNDPYLTNEPKVLVLNFLDEASLRRLCASGDVALFDVSDGVRFNIPRISSMTYAHNSAMRDAMAALGCGRRLAGAGM